MKYFNKIDAADIYLSPVRVEDAEKYVEWLSKPDISDKLHNTHKIFNIESEKDFLLDTLKKGNYIFGIIRKNDNTLIGNCGISNINHIDNTATVGIFIGDTNNQNKGYGTLALKALVNYGFSVLNLNNINLSVIDFNEGAIKCYQKVGFSEYGRRHQAYYVNNAYHDIVYMEVLKDRFYNNMNS